MCQFSDRTQYCRCGCVGRLPRVFLVVMSHRTSNASDAEFFLHHFLAPTCRWTLGFPDMGLCILVSASFFQLLPSIPSTIKFLSLVSIAQHAERDAATTTVFLSVRPSVCHALLLCKMTKLIMKLSTLHSSLGTLVFHAKATDELLMGHAQRRRQIKVG